MTNNKEPASGQASGGSRTHDGHDSIDRRIRAEAQRTSVMLVQFFMAVPGPACPFTVGATITAQALLILLLLPPLIVAYLFMQGGNHV